MDECRDAVQVVGGQFNQSPSHIVGCAALAGVVLFAVNCVGVDDRFRGFVEFVVRFDAAYGAFYVANRSGAFVVGVSGANRDACFVAASASARVRVVTGDYL